MKKRACPNSCLGFDRVLDGASYEVVFVDDGSSDGSWKVVQGLKEQYGDKVVGISFARNQGKSAALAYGFQGGQAARW